LRGWLGAVAAVVCGAPCLASGPLAPLLACRDLTDASARLACFDRESAALAAVPAAAAVPPKAAPPAAAPPAAAAAASLATAPAAAHPAGAAPPADAKEDFGLPEPVVAAKEVAAGTRAPEVSNIDAHLAAVSTGPNGRATFTLDNGQVWRQLLSEGDLLAKPGDPVAISRGMLRSYWLRLKSGRGCKVTRVL
jgi:hypothetical protein